MKKAFLLLTMIYWSQSSLADSKFSCPGGNCNRGNGQEVNIDNSGSGQTIHVTPGSEGTTVTFGAFEQHYNGPVTIIKQDHGQEQRQVDEDEKDDCESLDFKIEIEKTSITEDPSHSRNKIKNLIREFQIQCANSNTDSRPMGYSHQ